VADNVVATVAIGAYNKIQNPAAHPTANLPPGGKAAMFFFYLWTAFYAVSCVSSPVSSHPQSAKLTLPRSHSWNGTPWVVNSESFPGAVRQVTQCFAATSNWLCASQLLASPLLE
jgi:hypothetical protein